MASERKNMKRIVAVVERGEGKKGWWTNIGVAFENNDGSWNLRFDYYPTAPSTTIQLREMNERERQDEPGQPE